MPPGLRAANTALVTTALYRGMPLNSNTFQGKESNPVTRLKRDINSLLENRKGICSVVIFADEVSASFNLLPLKLLLSWGKAKRVKVRA